MNIKKLTKVSSENNLPKLKKIVKKSDDASKENIQDATQVVTEEPKEEDNRIKVLLISDDIRSHTGVASMAREIVMGTRDRINWAQMACSRIHPENGKKVIVDGIPLYCTSGFGTDNHVLDLLNKEKPDAVLLFTDPRHFFTQWRMENHIRSTIPMMYYTIWDNYPAPHYNLPYYESCDGLFCISRQSEDIVKKVLGEELASSKVISYVPHGIKEDMFKPMEFDEYESFFERIDKNYYTDDFDFVFLWSNKNMIRKCSMDAVLAYNEFCMTLDPEQRERVCLIMNTNKVQEEGTDLLVFIRDNCDPSVNIFFIENGSMSRDDIVKLYNIADVTINNSNAEGFGLASAESIMCGTPVISTVTGGLQDQMGFPEDEEQFEGGERSRHYDKRLGRLDRIESHGEWVFPLFPEAPTFIGSPLTPYIYQDNTSYVQIAERMKEAYTLGREELERRGLVGRQWMIDSGFTNTDMVEGIYHGIIQTMENFKPKTKFEIVKVV